MNPKTLQYLLGRSDISVTLNTYIGILETKKNEQASEGLSLDDGIPYNKPKRHRRTGGGLQ